MRSEGRRELWKITEMRGGAIYATQSLGSDVWVAIGLTTAEENEIAKELGGDFLGSISTSDKNPLIRTIMDDGTIHWI